RRTVAEALAWLLNGAQVDAALRIANAEHPPESLARACQALDVLLDGVLLVCKANGVPHQNQPRRGRRAA
ncbi:hypothetical protein ACNQQV_32055, partial [Pseudomonas aeruginosa]